MARSAQDRPQVLIESRAEWRAWLTENHADSTGIWLVRWKKGRGPAVMYDEVVEEALCFGWVDSLPRSLDDDRTQLLLTPRKPTSRWSAVNKERVARLTASGAMAPAGLAMVRLAEESGTWVGDSFPPSARRGILEWILDARTAPTREKRITTTVSEAHDGRRANQWPKAR